MPSVSGDAGVDEAVAELDDRLADCALATRSASLSVADEQDVPRRGDLADEQHYALWRPPRLGAIERLHRTFQRPILA